MKYNQDKSKYSHMRQQSPYFPNVEIPLLELNKQTKQVDIKKKSSITAISNTKKQKQKQRGHDTSDSRLEFVGQKMQTFKKLSNSQQYTQNRMLTSSKWENRHSQIKQPPSKPHSPYSHYTHDSKAFQNSIKAIEEIMEEENKNLKEQNQYLLKTIRGMKKKEKVYLERIRSCQSRIQQLEKQNTLQREQYSQVKKYVIEGIYRMENIVEKDSITSSQTDGTHLQQGTGQSDTTSANLSDIIENLNEKFDNLMCSYQKTNNPEFRKQSVELARKIKRLKLMRDSKQSADQHEYYEKKPKQYHRYSPQLNFQGK